MDPNLTGEVVIELDRPRAIKFSTFTSFRLSRHRRHLGENWDYQQVLTYIWAMLPKEALEIFKDPEDLGVYITPENLPVYMDKLLEAIKDGMAESPEKKSNLNSGPSSELK